MIVLISEKVLYMLTLSIFDGFISIFLIHKLALRNKKNIILHSLFTFLFMTLTIFALTIFRIKLYTKVIIISVLMLLFLHFYELNRLSILLIILSYYFFQIITDIFVSMIISKIFSIKISIYSIDYTFNIFIIILISKLIILLIVDFIGDKYIPYNLILPNSINLCIVFLLGTSIISLLTFFYISITVNLELMRVAIFVLCLFIITIAYIVIFLHHKSYDFYIALKNETTKQLFSKLNKEYFKKIQEENKKISKLWHDMNNQLLVIEGINNKYISNDYLNSLKYKMNSIPKNLKTGNHILDIILNNKYLEATKKGISFDIKATIPSTLLMEDIDLSAILFNTIDNAIEANLNCNLDKKYIKLIMTKEDNFIYYKIKNSYSKIKYKDNYHFYNKKANINSGYGLNIVRDIVYKYNGNMTIKKSEDEYSVTIIIPL